MTGPADTVDSLIAACDAAVKDGLNSDLCGRTRWTAAQYEIATDGGVATVTGWVRGWFGVADDNSRWRITHLPTGYIIVDAVRDPALLQLIDDLAALDGWGTADPAACRALLGQEVASLIRAFWWREAAQ